MMDNGLSAYRRFLQFLLKSPVRAVTLVPLVLAGTYVIGFSASALLMSAGGSTNKLVAVQPVLAYRLLSLVPVVHAAAVAPQPCTTTCKALDPNSYNTTSDFYTTNPAGVDFPFVVPGDPNTVGYINVNSPRKSITKRFDQ